MKRILFSLMASVLATGSVMASTSDTLSIDGAVGKLFTIVQKPTMTTDEQLPVVIICHGFGSNCRTPLLTAIADDVVQQGMIAVRFDFNGCGKSDGLFQNMTVPNEIDDLIHVVEWVRTQPWTRNVSLVGHSQGGVVVSMTAGRLGDGIIKCEALLAPAAVLRDDAIRGITMGANYNPYDIKGDYVQLPGRGRSSGPKLGKDYIQTAMTLPIYETAANYNGPVLIVHGTNDQVVPYTYSERYHEKIAHSELHMVPGEDHRFTNTYSESALLVADWLHKQLD